MNELKSCPFCGSEAITTAFFDADDFDYIPIEVNDNDAEVTCENERCINGWYLSPKAWNTRPIEDALQSRIAELQAAQRWHVVNDGDLPIVGKSIMFYDSSSKEIYRGVYTASHHWRANYFSEKCATVTHWMPLPESPIMYGKVYEE